MLDYDGKYKNEMTNTTINCYICKKSTKYYKQEDKTIKKKKIIADNKETA